MKRISPFLGLLLFFACQPLSPPPPSQLPAQTQAESLANARVRSNNSRQRVVVANRASGDISVIDAGTNSLLGTYALPDNGEPMYVNHSARAGKVFVGDRANNRVVAFDEDDFTVKGMVPTGNGVFHMWISPSGSHLWVNNDIDNTTTVIEIKPNSMSVVGTAATPADLVALGGKPHDVFVDPVNGAAYVSVLGVAGADDYVVKYDPHTLMEVNRVAVGKDPHLFADDVNKKLYVASQGGNAIYVVDRKTMTIGNTIPFHAAHGIFMTPAGDHIYATNISGAELGVFSTTTEMMVGSPVGTPFPIPHNIVVNARARKLFVTHSGGTADKLSIYRMVGGSPLPQFVTSLTVGVNPFGLAYYRY